jgi:hypothetical protein
MFYLNILSFPIKEKIKLQDRKRMYHYIEKQYHGMTPKLWCVGRH